MATDLTTSRLRLREWRDTDRPAWAALNADPAVREFFPTSLTRAEADATLDYFQSELSTRGWGWWALELTATAELIGMAGLDPVDEEVPFDGVELGWRLARPQWGHGYATEAAQAVTSFAFESLHLPEILALAAAGNTRSHAVMRRLGMTYVRDFTDPTQPPHLAASVLYTLKNPKTSDRTRLSRAPASPPRPSATHPPCAAAGLSRVSR